MVNIYQNTLNHTPTTCTVRQLVTISHKIGTKILKGGGSAFFKKLFFQPNNNYLLKEGKDCSKRKHILYYQHYLALPEIFNLFSVVDDSFICSKIALVGKDKPHYQLILFPQSPDQLLSESHLKKLQAKLQI